MGDSTMRGPDDDCGLRTSPAWGDAMTLELLPCWLLPWGLFTVAVLLLPVGVPSRGAVPSAPAGAVPAAGEPGCVACSVVDVPAAAPVAGTCPLRMSALHMGHSTLRPSHVSMQPDASHQSSGGDA